MYLVRGVGRKSHQGENPLPLRLDGGVQLRQFGQRCFEFDSEHACVGGVHFAHIGEASGRFDQRFELFRVLAGDAKAFDADRPREPRLAQLDDRLPFRQRNAAPGDVVFAPRAILLGQQAAGDGDRDAEADADGPGAADLVALLARDAGRAELQAVGADAFDGRRFELPAVALAAIEAPQHLELKLRIVPPAGLAGGGERDIGGKPRSHQFRVEVERDGLCFKEGEAVLRIECHSLFRAAFGQAADILGDRFDVEIARSPFGCMRGHVERLAFVLCAAGR